MKPNYIFLLALFIVTGCNSKNNQSGKTENETTVESKTLAANETNDELLTADLYAGRYTFTTNEEEGPVGCVIIYHETGNTISFDLNINMGAPSFNSGELSGEVEIVNGKGLFRNSDFGDCILDFSFADNSVSISPQEGGNNCGFGHNVVVNNTFIREPVDESVKTNENLLWKIFLKVPADSMPDYMFTTVQQRRQARIDNQFHVNRYEDAENMLSYDETDENGVRYFVRLAFYPTDDGKKLIVLFHYGGGVDIFSTNSDQTYEYDITTSDLKVIERPIDPYTAEEFFYEHIYTPKQLKTVREAFYEKKPLNYIDINSSGYSMYFAAHDAFEHWDEYEEYSDMMSEFYEKRDNFVRRDWNGKRFVKAENFPPDYLIDGHSVGRYKIGQQIAYQYTSDDDYRKMVRSERTEIREGTAEKIIEYAIIEFRDTMLILKPSYDYEKEAYTDKIGEIIVISEKYKTKNKIGVNSEIDDFIAAYPNNKFWWTYVSDKYVLESEDIGDNIQFLLDADDCTITPNTNSDMTLLKRADFKKDSQIKKIRVM